MVGPGAHGVDRANQNTAAAPWMTGVDGFQLRTTHGHAVKLMATVMQQGTTLDSRPTTAAVQKKL